VSLKNAKSTLQKTITYIKKNGKGYQEWDKACRDVNLPPYKLKTLLKISLDNKVVFFQET
jgi:hypothetical protein